MVRNAMRVGIWWACILLAACGGSAMSASPPESLPDSSAGYGGAAPPAEPAPQAQGMMFAGAVTRTSSDEARPEPPSSPAPVSGSTAGKPSVVDKKLEQPNRLAQNTAQPQSQPGTTPPTQPKQKDREQRADVESVAQPMLVYTATLTMAVFEVKKSLGDVEALARELGGFLSRRSDTQISIRVPVARFDDAIGRLEKMGDVVARNVTAEDVTEEFFDLDVRLKSSRAVRDRLEQLLQKAVKVEDSVLIERELTRVVGEIERIEGRMKFLRDRASYSTITVDFRARGSERVGNGPFNLPVPWLSELGLRRLLNL
ncbi:MAG: DUF4349 domain-containing protein [Polyangiaceae bacterium]